MAMKIILVVEPVSRDGNEVFRKKFKYVTDGQNKN